MADPLDNPLVQAQSARIAELIALLRELEWSGDRYDDHCPACSAYKGGQHNPDCRLAAAIKEPE